MAVLGATLLQLGRRADGEDLLRKTLDIQRRVLGQDHGNVRWTLRELIAYYRKTGDMVSVRPLMAELLSSLRAAAGQPDARAARNNEYAWMLLRLQTDLPRASDSPQSLRDTIFAKTLLAWSPRVTVPEQRADEGAVDQERFDKLREIVAAAVGLESRERTALQVRLVRCFRGDL